MLEKLDEMAKRLESGEVAVGFMAGAMYPDGTPVAAVAFWNEYGHGGTFPAPPRPFFRRMIAKESPGWGAKTAQQLKLTDYDADKTLGHMGEDIQGALKQSINEFQSPPLAERTIAAKGFAKPLIDTAHMLNSITYKVSE